jgi:hypothetical protein
MNNKFIVTECRGIKQVGFNGAMGVSVLDVEEIVHMLNGFNNTCIKLEGRIVELEVSAYLEVKDNPDEN